METCPACRKNKGILWTAVKTNAYGDQELFNLCSSCLKVRFCMLPEYHQAVIGGPLTKVSP